MKRALILAAALALGACDQAQTLPSARNSDGHIVLPPLCTPAALAEINVQVTKVPRSSPLLHPSGLDADGRWIRLGSTSIILVRDDLAGWVFEDTVQHEKCHELHFRSTGSPVFHR